MGPWIKYTNIAYKLFFFFFSIASYLIIAIPIFGGFYEDMTPGDLAKLVSNNAFVCMMLIYQVKLFTAPTYSYPKPSLAEPAGNHDRDGRRNGRVNVQGDRDVGATAVDARQAWGDAKTSSTWSSTEHSENWHCGCWIWKCSHQWT